MDQRTIDLLTYVVSAPLVAGSAAVLGMLAKEWATRKRGDASLPMPGTKPVGPVPAPTERTPELEEATESDPPENHQGEAPTSVPEPPDQPTAPPPIVVLPPPDPPAAPAPTVAAGSVHIGDLAVEVWRLNRRWDRTNLGESAGGRHIADSLRRLEDALLAQRVETRMHDGDRYRDGSRLRVSHVEGDDLAIDARSVLVVTETIEPSILVDGVVVRPGLVVVSKLESGVTREGAE